MAAAAADLTVLTVLNVEFTSVRVIVVTFRRLAIAVVVAAAVDVVAHLSLLVFGRSQEVVESGAGAELLFGVGQRGLLNLGEQDPVDLGARPSSRLHLMKLLRQQREEEVLVGARMEVKESHSLQVLA